MFVAFFFLLSLLFFFPVIVSSVFCTIEVYKENTKSKILDWLLVPKDNTTITKDNSNNSDSYNNVTDNTNYNCYHNIMLKMMTVMVATHYLERVKISASGSKSWVAVLPIKN